MSEGLVGFQQIDQLTTCWVKLFESQSINHLQRFGQVMGASSTGLIIAHPDDETMFFFPTISNYVRKGVEINILCLSTGNAFGKGNVRIKELKQVCKVGFKGVQCGNSK
eukprot:TRINITY_DN15666_c0_g2_i1.p3 TRINITY_DN15666_c0_g2~~TRINITY_DN15666_c0_g2_i1.p3  ORF type:complete len:125 (+),score=6.24 TRINITY_DN15666_c0_g2_i1:49-375(+)